MFPVVSVKDVKVKLGELVKKMRRQEGLTQEELGHKLNLSRITIQNLESGKNATMDTAFLVMQHFGLLEDFYKQVESRMSDDIYGSLY